MNHCNLLIRLEYRVAVSSHYRPTFIQSVVFAERMLDAPCVTIQKTLQNILQIDDFRGACAVKGNVQVAGRTSSVSTMEMLSTHDVTLRNVDGSLFHVHI